MAKLRQWVGHSQVVIQPVLNMARRDAVDQHDPPAWMRELASSAMATGSPPRHAPADQRDKDHIDAYSPARKVGHPAEPPRALAGREGGTTAPKPPPLAVHPHAPGHYLWHGPHGATYLVTDTGTHRH